MQLELQVRYFTEDISWLCFRHAVTRALEGEDVHVEVDSFYDEHYLGTINCVDCEAEEVKDEVQST